MFNYSLPFSQSQIDQFFTRDLSGSQRSWPIICGRGLTGAVDGFAHLVILPLARRYFYKSRPWRPIEIPFRICYTYTSALCRVVADTPSPTDQRRTNVLITVKLSSPRL